MWFPVPREERADLRAFQNDVAAFSFGSIFKQVASSKTCNTMKPTVDAWLAENSASKSYRTTRRTKTLLDKGESVDKIIVFRDEGRKGKTARNILYKTVFGDRASQASMQAVITALCAQRFDFDEFSPKDWLRSIFMAKSGGSPFFERKPCGNDSDQMNWRWKSVSVILNLNCVPCVSATRDEAFPSGRAARRAI